MASEHLMPAMVGFLLTAVGLPLLTLVAVARGSAGQGSSGWTAMTRYLPTWAATALAIAIYIIMGPLPPPAPGWWLMKWGSSPG